jgi:hypothetical protein
LTTGSADSALATDARFDVVDFQLVDTGGSHGFQSLTLRRPDAP